MGYIEHRLEYNTYRSDKLPSRDGGISGVQSRAAPSAVRASRREPATDQDVGSFLNTSSMEVS